MHNDHICTSSMFNSLTLSVIWLNVDADIPMLIWMMTRKTTGLQHQNR